MTRRRVHAEPRRYWTAHEDAVLRVAYPEVVARDLVARLPGRTLDSIYQRARVLGLVKSEAFLLSAASGRLRGERGRATRFAMGGASWNKGKRYQPGGRASLTQFTKGQRPHNVAPIGTRRRTSSDGYWRVKVAEPNVWRFVHREVWEAAHGPVPAGMALRFRDGDRGNCALDNLELVERRVLMARNSVHNMPAPLPELVMLRGALVRKINRRMREVAHEE